MLNKRIIYITGLPRAGSTLLCQLLDHHPDIYSPGHSSPLATLLEKIREFLSESPFFLSQLDVDFDLAYQRLLHTSRGAMNGWFEETDSLFVVDKSRHWVNLIETLYVLDPDFKMLVCLRDLTEVYGSVEAQHQKTRLLNFPDHTSPNHYYSRLDSLFQDDGVIGGPLRGIQNLQYVDNGEIKNRVCYIEFDALTHQPQEVMNTVYDWLEMPRFAFNPEKLRVKPHESDSYYRFKYPHQTRERIAPLPLHLVSEQLKTEIYKRFPWFYQTFYPEKYEAMTRQGII
ncbi:MAG: sulfotransferase [Candidatus Competibacteraceae bacterium]|nr:sulfotransferase [Candidatus Competibacteraceae bacterium]